MPKNPNNDLPPEYIQSLFDYNPETGELKWRERIDVPPKWNGRYAGTKAGSVTKGHIDIRIHKVHFSAHRLIWAIMTGRWPENDIDHVDTNGLNNRWSNLREATDSQNNWNRGPRADNTSGFKGVSRSRGAWRAQIVAHGKHRHLGVFPTKEMAAEAYKAAAAQFHGSFARS